MFDALGKNDAAKILQPGHIITVYKDIMIRLGYLTSNVSFDIEPYQDLLTFTVTTTSFKLQLILTSTLCIYIDWCIY